MDITNLARLVLRDETDAPPVECNTNNEYDGRMGLRISSIFVILVGSTLGAVFPVFARRRIHNRFMDLGFFFAKYFGSGVIIATAFIHLLAPAQEALGNPCLTGAITEYPWPMGIALMMIFVLFFVELMTVRFATFSSFKADDFESASDHDLKQHHHHEITREGNHKTSLTDSATNTTALAPTTQIDAANYSDNPSTHVHGEDHLGHGREHKSDDATALDPIPRRETAESYVSQMTAIFILEFGIIFHSVFIGLTLAVAGDEFITLYIVLVFHQTFEGLGLGTRLASTPWPRSKRWTPYVLAIAYGLSTPIAIAAGLGVRESYPPESSTTLLVNGVFDSLSAGILIYTGLVELMAHEFMFSPTMRRAPIKTVLTAFLFMCLGAGLMALLGKWA